MNSQVGYVVCSFSTTIELPVAALPMPMIGAPLPVKLVADWLLIPLDPLPEEVGLVEPEDPNDDDPNVDPELPEAPEAPDEPNVDPPDAPFDAPLAADPELPDPNEEDPNVDPELPDVPEVPAAPAPIAPLEADPAALPRPPAPERPVNGFPKKPFTVVFASPTWIIFQSGLPVIGSA